MSRAVQGRRDGEHRARQAAAVRAGVAAQWELAEASRGGAGKATRYRLTDRGPLAPGAAGLLTPQELAQLLGRPSKTREPAENLRSAAAGFFS